MQTTIDHEHTPTFRMFSYRKAIYKKKKKEFPHLL